MVRKGLILAFWNKRRNNFLWWGKSTKSRKIRIFRSRTLKYSKRFRKFRIKVRSCRPITRRLNKLRGSSLLLVREPPNTSTDIWKVRWCKPWDRTNNKIHNLRIDMIKGRKRSTTQSRITKASSYYNRISKRWRASSRVRSKLLGQSSKI